MAQDSYKDILGFTWKKENGKYVQYRGDGSRTGKIKDAKNFKAFKVEATEKKKTNSNASQKNRPTRGSGAKKRNYVKPKITNPNKPKTWKVGDTFNGVVNKDGSLSRVMRRRVGKKWIDPPKLVYTGTKWVSPEAYKKITPDRVGKIDKYSKEYRFAKQINESVGRENKKDNNTLKINKKKEKVVEENNNKVVEENNNKVVENNNNKVVEENKEKSKYPEVTQKQLDKKIAEIKNKNNKVVSKNDKLKIKKGSAKNWIKTKKGFARRGTPMARRAEEREKARKRLAAKGYMKNK